MRRRPKAPPIAGPTEGRAVALPISLCGIAKADMERSPKGDESTEAVAEVPDRPPGREGEVGVRKNLFFRIITPNLVPVP